MKKLAILMSAACIIGLSSCDNRENIQGQWQSSPIKLDMPQAATSTATLCYVFGADGSVSLASDITVTEPLQPISIDSISPYQVTVVASASMNGTWQYVKGENDEVAIVFDESTFSLNIDPDAVTLAQNMTTGAQAPSTVEMKQGVADRYKALLTPETKALYTRFSRLDDIKVDKKFLNCEIGDRDYILRRIDWRID